MTLKDYIVPVVGESTHTTPTGKETLGSGILDDKIETMFNDTTYNKLWAYLAVGMETIWKPKQNEATTSMEEYIRSYMYILKEG